MTKKDFMKDYLKHETEGAILATAFLAILIFILTILVIGLLI